MNNLVTLTPQVQIVTTTKKLVDSLLAMNTRNRSPKVSHINRLAADVESGQFLLTASGIGVSNTGVLLDGQNRLMAIRQAGYPPCKLVLVTGLDDDSQRVVDRHSKRSLGDALTLHMNITISGHMVALANAVHAFGASKGKYEKFVFSGRGVGTQLSDGAAAHVMAEHGDLIAEVVSASGGARASVMAALFVYAYHDHDRAIEFCHDVNKGVNLQEDHPAYRLRGSIDRLKKQSDAIGRMELFKTAVSAVICHATGRTTKMLKASESWANAPWKWSIPVIGKVD